MVAPEGASAGVTTVADAKCAAPQSVLSYLHRNATAHAILCQAGFCMAPLAQQGICGTAVQWGDLPCFSTAFDWRDGVLAPVSEWQTILGDVQTAMLAMPYLPVQSQLRMILSELKNISTTAIDLSSHHLRSHYMISTHRLYNSDYTKEVKTALDAAIKSVSVVSARSRSTPTVTGPDQINVFWMSWAPVGLLPSVYLDMLFAIASMAFIFLYITFNVGSLILACAAMFEIIMSIPLALTLWKIVLGQDNIDFLQLVMVFLILCIGADDVFVYTDTWKASAAMPNHISGSYHTRFAWTWAKAAGTMFATTLTTCICLGLTALSTIPTVRSFGLFGSFLVLVDYIQVITWYPAVVLWHDKHWCFATGHMCGPKKVEGPRKPQLIARMMRDKVAPTLYKLRYACLLLSVAFAAGGVYMRVTMFEPAASIPLFKPNHPWEMRGQIVADNFFSATSDSDDKVHVGLIYGLEATPVTYSGSTQLLPDRDQQDVTRTVMYSNSLDLSPTAQENMVTACDAALADPSLVEGSEGFCLLKDVKAMDPSSFPYATVSDLITAIQSLPLSEHTCGGTLCNNTDFLYGTYLRKTGYVSDGSGGIKAIYNSFVTTLSRRQVRGSIFGGDPRISTPVVNRWDDFASQHCNNDVSICFATVYGVSGAVGFGGLLGSLSSFANSTIFVCVIASFFVLVLVTMNVIVALYATLTVGAVIGGVMGLIILCGMKVSERERAAHKQHIHTSRTLRTR